MPTLAPMTARAFAEHIRGGCYITSTDTDTHVYHYSTTSRDRPKRAAQACEPWWSEASEACASVLLIAGMLAMTHLLARPLRCDWGCEGHDAWCARENGHGGACACADCK